ncbi:hypothetical protein HDV00_005512 [Rhizophlyctis rosea]|nr:hypothetical protein HDV00_005512 [Rhizophlyctis rosea]
MRHEERKFTCSVLVDGQPLEEWQTEVDGYTTSCWVAAEEGKRYTVRVMNKSYTTTENNNLVAQIWIDGNKAGSMLLPYMLSQSFKGVSEGASVRPAMFGPLATTSSEDVGSASEAPAWAKELSTIVVKIFKCYRVLSSKPKTAATTAATKSTTPAISGIKEKIAKKNKVMCDRITNFGEPEPPLPKGGPDNLGQPNSTPAKRILRSMKMPTTPLVKAKKSKTKQSTGWHRRFYEGGPYCEFRFSYRSRDMLEAQDIFPIPQTDEYAPTHQHNNSSNLVPTKIEKASPDHKRNVPSDLVPTKSEASSSTRKRANSDDVLPIKIKKEKLEPRFPKEEGILIDLEAPGGWVETRNPWPRKEVEVIDLEGDVSE